MMFLSGSQDRDSVELIKVIGLSPLVKVDSELAVVKEFPLKCLQIPVKKCGRPQYMQHHEMSLERKTMYIFWESSWQTIWNQRWQWSHASPSSS